jgi:hypothetical protein
VSQNCAIRFSSLPGRCGAQKLGPPKFSVNQHLAAAEAELK